MADRAALQATRGSTDLVAVAMRASEPLTNVHPNRPRSVPEPQRPSQVPVLDGTTRLTGSPSLGGRQAHHKPPRPSTTPLQPVPISARIQRCGGVLPDARPRSAQRYCGPSCECSTCSKGSTSTPPTAEMATPPERSVGNRATDQLLAGLAVRHVMSQPGEELDPSVRASMEDRFDSDFSDVYIHRDSRAAASARALDAHAYTVGSHIAFAPGKYDPASADGQFTLAHELAHVVQQRNAAVSGLPIGDDVTVSQPDDPSEQAAENRAREVMHSGTPASGDVAPSRDALSARGQGTVVRRACAECDAEDETQLQRRVKAEAIGMRATDEIVQRQDAGLGDSPDQGPVPSTITVPEVTIVATAPASFRSAIGSTDYYFLRASDFVSRNPGEIPPTYYMFYGDKYVNRFRTILRPSLSDAGQSWLDCTLNGLQTAIENRRDANPWAFAELERDSDKFQDFAYATHADVYVNCGVCNLSIFDEAKILDTPDFRDLLTLDGVSQIIDVFLQCQWEWFAPVGPPVEGP